MVEGDGVFIAPNDTLTEKPDGSDGQVHNTHDDGDDVNMETSNVHSALPRVRQYPMGHTGPYIVYVRSSDGNGLKQVNVSKLIFDSCKPFVERIDHVNAYKMRVVFKNQQAANKAPLLECLKPFRVYVPASEVEVDGIVRLDPSEDAKDLEIYGRGMFDSLKLSDTKILEAYRVHRKEAGTSVPTNVVRVTFPGKVLPDRVVLDGLRIPVRLYRPLEMVCTRCLKTGHTEKMCVSKPRCGKCGEAHLTVGCRKEDDLPPECVRCKRIHEPDQSKCPKVVAANQRRLLKAKQRHELSYAEAVRKMKQHAKPNLSEDNMYDALSESDEEEDYPSLLAPGTKRTRKHSAGPSKPKRIAKMGGEEKIENSKHPKNDRKKKAEGKQENGVGYPRRAKPEETESNSLLASCRAVFLEVVESLKLPAPFAKIAVTIVGILFDKFAPVLIARCCEIVEDA